MRKKVAYFIASFILPISAFAQAASGSETAQTFFDNVKTNIVNPIITVIAIAAFVVFVWGVVDFIRSADDAEKRKTGQQHMIWGIVGLVIIFGANAIISILKNTFGF
jgi:uncharacterized membrane protein YidH (DUF202 family)